MDPVSPKVLPLTFHKKLLLTFLQPAGKFPTPLSHGEDLSNKIVEVRSTIKFQLKKVLCLGVAVGHVEMNDDQVFANVMLSTYFLWICYAKNDSLTPFLRRYQFPCIASEEELAECQVFAHQDNDGQAYSPLLVVGRETTWWSARSRLNEGGR